MTESTGEEPRILGSLHVADGLGLVRIETTVERSPGAVWAALTEPARLADWLGEATGELREGGEYRGRWRVSGWDGVGRIRVCEPPRRLVLASREVDAAEDNRTEITITPTGAGSAIVVEEQGMPLEQVAAYGAGTQVHVEDLTAHLDGRPERHTSERWGALYPAYQALPVEEEAEPDRRSGRSTRDRHWRGRGARR